MPASKRPGAGSRAARTEAKLMPRRPRRPRRYVTLDPGVWLGLFADMPDRPKPSEGPLFADLADPKEPEQSSRPRPSKRPRKGRRRPDKSTEADRREAWTAPTQDETPPPKIP